MIKRIRWWLVALLGLAIIGGCQKAGNSGSGESSSGGGSESSQYLLADEPVGARGVLEVKGDVKDGDVVLVVGRVGGRVDPFVKGRASFTIVDPSLKSCSDRPGDNCETPWDYCCEHPNDLARATLFVKFTDEEGKAVERDARELLGIKPSQTVVVRGKAKRDADGNLTVLASALYARGNTP